MFVNNVQQEPGSGKSYTASGTTLTFDEAPPSGTGNVYVIYRGEATINPRLEHDANAALSATTGTFTGAFTSPGIDDNADATAITIDSSENVGIGTGSPAATLTVSHASGVDGRGIRLVNSSNNQAYETRIGVEGIENTSYAIKDMTANAVRFLMDTSGNVGIGTAPSVALHVKAGSGQIRLHEGNAADNKYGQIEVSNGKLILHSDKGNVEGSSDMRFNIDNSERVRIDLNGTTTFFTGSGEGAAKITTDVSAGTSYNLFQARHSASSITSNGTQCFFVTTNGNVYNTNGSYGAGSDQKLKENIVDSNSQWDDIKALQVRNFNKIGNTDVHIGVVAQELEAAGMGGLVDEHTDVDEDGNDLGTVTKSVKYSILYMKAVKALQEAITKIETLEAKVTALEGN